MPNGARRRWHQYQQLGCPPQIDPSHSPQKISNKSHKSPSFVSFQGGPRLVPQKWAVKASASGSPPGLYSAKIFELTPQNVDMVLEDVRPYLISDGGNVDVVSVADGVISLKLQGCAVNDYIQAVRSLSCEMLDLVVEGLFVPDKSVFSRLIRDVHSDSCFRLNHYPPMENSREWDPSPKLNANTRMRFGEHSDPQILTILLSNDVEGLQICLHDGLWVLVTPDPTEFCVFVGDVLQRKTQRIVANSVKPRMSMIYFGAPPLNAWISPLPKMVSPQKPSLYKPFTWSEFKKAAYSLPWEDCRLNRFKDSLQISLRTQKL
ncbi:unnamed protein product [Camellia sinensis]